MSCPPFFAVAFVDARCVLADIGDFLDDKREGRGVLIFRDGKAPSVV